MEHIPEQISEDIVREIEDAIHDREGDLAKAEVDLYLQKLDTAIAITNEPHARELGQHLLERFG